MEGALPIFIEDICVKRFGKGRPDRVLPIAKIAQYEHGMES